MKPTENPMHLTIKYKQCKQHNTRDPFLMIKAKFDFTKNYPHHNSHTNKTGICVFM